MTDALAILYLYVIGMAFSLVYTYFYASYMIGLCI